jgi:signal transduction histidine kinase
MVSGGPFMAGARPPWYIGGRDKERSMGLKANLDLRCKIIFPFVLLTGDLFGYVRYLSIKGGVIDPYGSAVDYRGLLALSALLILPLTAYYKRLVNVLFLLVKLVVLLFIITLTNDDLTITVILSTAYLLAAGFYARPPYNIVLAIFAGTSILLFQRSIRIDDFATPTIRPDELLMLGFLFAVIVILDWVISDVIRAHGAQGERIESQREAIIRLIETNVGTQRFALTKKGEYEDAERLRITRDIHDTIGYVMTNNIMLLRACTYCVPERLKKARAFLDDALKNAETGLGETRSILKKLHDIDGRASGAGEIMKIVRLFQESTGIEVKCSFGNTTGTWGKGLNYAFYRIIQEGLVNSVKHGKATEVSVGFWHTGEELLLTISDNGRGSQEDQTKMGIGLAGMRERLERFGGTLDARGFPHGFSLHIAVPAASADAEAR